MKWSEELLKSFGNSDSKKLFNLNSARKDQNLNKDKYRTLLQKMNFTSDNFKLQETQNQNQTGEIDFSIYSGNTQNGKIYKSNVNFYKIIYFFFFQMSFKKNFKSGHF